MIDQFLFSMASLFTNIPVGGRLKLFLQNPWILDTVQGISLDFLTTPVQSNLTNLYFYKKAVQDAEVMNVVKKNAGCPADTMGDSFISNIFCVQKKGGGKRPVINLKRLNEFLRYEHFKMEGIHLLNDLLLPKDWMV